MKIKSENKGKYEVEFEKTVTTTQTFDREAVVAKIAEIQSNEDACAADKAKYEGILALIDNK